MLTKGGVVIADVIYGWSWSQRPSQIIEVRKFRSPLARKAYCYIKALKKALGLDREIKYVRKIFRIFDPLPLSTF